LAANETPRCDVCGATYEERPLTLTVKFRETTCYCSTCERLVDAGMLRPEMVDGVLRFRQWHIGEWTPGELLPTSKAMAA